MQVYYCPNRDCPYEKKLGQGEKCPECGSEANPFGFMGIAGLISAKSMQTKVAERIEENKAKLLVSDQMTDEEIRKKIFEDMLNLAMHEAGTGWMRMGTLLSGNPTDQMLGAGFKALIDQNKIMIRQNELILRTLKGKLK